MPPRERRAAPHEHAGPAEPADAGHATRGHAGHGRRADAGHAAAPPLPGHQQGLLGQPGLGARDAAAPAHDAPTPDALPPRRRQDTYRDP